MEVYILDSVFRRVQVVDRFESLIWTERWDDIGDFELHIASSPTIKALFLPDTKLAVNTSKRVMIVETVEDNTDEENRRILTIKGRSIEKITEDRILAQTYAGFNRLPYYTVNNQTPADGMHTMFNNIFLGGMIHPNDVLPLYVSGGTLYPTDTIVAPTTVIVQNIDAGSLYTALRLLSQVWDLGWRLYRNGDNQQLFFNVYAGSDRTVKQTALNAIVFSPEMENLQNTTELSTTEQAKNVAYVFNSDGTSINTYAPGVDTTITGFDRKAVVVKTSIKASDVPDLTAALTREGQDALAKVRAFRAFDGQITQYPGYVYETDYFLGDLVTMQNADGYMNDMRVTEQIMTQDENGERSYPTLSLRQFYVPGTWEQAGARAWADAGTTEYWSNSL